MGATQSSPDAPPEAGAAVAKTCFYELLGLDRDATDAEIKKAYRKRALELHPDRNFGDVAQATQKFAELQSAYEVLSDPHERAWYDSHRDAILSGQDGTDAGMEPASFRNIRLTSTEEIMSLIRKFNANVPFNDESVGFFGIARQIFEHLAMEEEAAAEAEHLDIPEYPSFGFSDDDYDDIVKPFYSAWAGFATKKPFSWKDKYRLSDAPDRRVRRLMEKDNKKLRDEAAREFNDAVRFLVTFVRKRDTRYTSSTLSQEERVKSSRNAAAAQAARSRAANQESVASFEIPEWARSRDDCVNEEHFSLTEDESEVEIVECVICNKSFKSENQLEVHERSKKHLRATAELRREMRKEGLELELDNVVSAMEHTDPAEGNDDKDQRRDGQPSESPSSLPEASIEEEHAGDFERRNRVSSSSTTSADDDDYAPRSSILDRLAGEPQDVADACGPASELTGEDLSLLTQGITLEPTAPQKKIGKAKIKRERKAAAASAKGGVHNCVVCGSIFDSRTKLFNHIRQEGHASAPKRTSR